MVTIVDITFTSFSDILAKIGGFGSLVAYLFGLLGYYFFQMFLIKLARQIRDSHPREFNKSVKEIVASIKNRISYLQLYNLYDKLDEQQEQIGKVKQNAENLTSELIDQISELEQDHKKTKKNLKKQIKTDNEELKKENAELR